MRILITSAGTATSVNLIRYFHKAGDYVVSVDINPFGYTAGSMLADKFYQVPLAVDEAFVPEMINIIRENEIDIFIPINDIEVYKISCEIEKIPCKCMIPDRQTIELLRDKYLCSKKMEELGIPVPEIMPEYRSEKRILRDRIGVGSKGIKILSAQDATPQYREEDAFLQKFVEGEEYTVDVLADGDGQPVYIVPRARLEVKSGVATKVRIEKDDALTAYVRKILQNVTLPGFSNIQFIKDANGTYWFVEVNYRFAGCGAATLAACDSYLSQFKRIASGEKGSGDLNTDVRWNAIVTRYYEEMIYEEGIY